MHSSDTIVAPASPASEAAIAVVRVCGPLAAAIAQSSLGLPRLKPRLAQLATYTSLQHTPIDRLIAIFYQAPHSFTGEDVLELFPHGNPFIVRKLLDDLQSRGCRIASPGEFTKRAFINGRIDLTQAEAIAQVIRARSDRSLRAAQRQLEGAVGEVVAHIRHQLLHITAHIEAYIDFPEEDLPPENQAGPLNDLQRLAQELENLIATQSYNALLHDGIRCVIIGEPNVGKSSLLNALLGQARAIVSAEAGTTRDYLEDRMVLGPYLLRIVDTAGLHETLSAVEQEGIKRTMQQLQQADVLLIVIDSTQDSPTLQPFNAFPFPRSRIIVVENKDDHPEARQHPQFLPDCPHIRLSALHGTGLSQLRQAIISQVEDNHVVPDEDVVLVSARHATALESVKSGVELALQLLTTAQPAELAATHLHEAIAALGDIVGRIDHEEMLDALFKSFCIGK